MAFLEITEFAFISVPVADKVYLQDYKTQNCPWCKKLYKNDMTNDKNTQIKLKKGIFRNAQIR
ncbi:hypothetical protein ES708_15402 [subsurface metagenome]